MEDKENQDEYDMTRSQATTDEVSHSEENVSEYQGIESSSMGEKKSEPKVEENQMETDKESHTIADEDQIKKDSNTTNQPIENKDSSKAERVDVPSSNLAKTYLQKAKLGNMSYEEETELRKNTSIGAILSGLSTGSYGNKAKENVVTVEGRVKRGRYDNNFGYNKRYRSGWGDNSWNSWNDQYFEEEEEVVEPTNEDWIAEENKLLEDEFGPGVISIMYDDDIGMLYVCEVCQSQMNGRKSLDAHINGMKHLKKKNMWEKKRKLDGLLTIPLSAKDLAAKEEEKEKKKEEAENKENKDAQSAVPVPIKPQEENKRLEGSNYGPNKGYGQANYNNQFYNQPPPFEPPGMGMPPAPRLMVPPSTGPVGMGPPHLSSQKGPQGPQGPQGPPTNIPRGQWSNFDTTPPPPPATASVPIVPSVPKVVAAPVEEKPKVKINLSGGATGTLLQKLAACAVKNYKDSDLATNVVIALVKTMKEYNHERGDTKSIEVLTEIDVKLRGLKAQMPTIITADPEKKVDSIKIAATKPPATEPSQNPAYNYYSTSGAQSNSAGTWYSQGKGNSTPSNQQLSPGPKKVVSSSGPPAVGPVRNNASSYVAPTKGGQYNTNYPAYGSSHDQSAKDTAGYSSKPTHSSGSADGYYSRGMPDKQTSYGSYSAPVAPKAVMDIIQSSTAPPPPPPPESTATTGYGAQDYTATGYQAAYSGYYNTATTGSQYNQQY